MRNKNNIKNLTLSAMFMAVGMILPFFTGQIPQVGQMLLPMHIPVLLCGLVCGWQYGLAVGAVLPLLRCVTIGTPPIVLAIPMTFELATYGFVAGFTYSRSRWQCIIALYRCIIAAMLAGRIVWGVIKIAMLGLGKNGFTWQMFMASAFINAFPGIILQLVFIPTIMLALNRTGLVKFKRHTKREHGRG